jgi:hypothetical protein
MSALGQKQTFAPQKVMSALPLKAHQMRHMECPLWANSGHSDDDGRMKKEAANYGGLFPTLTLPTC